MELLNWQVKGSDLMLGGKKVSSIVEQFGTPLYLYDANIILDRANRVQRAFADFKVLYSIKANPNPAIAKILANVGMGAGVSSLVEIRLALQLGYPPSESAFGGPAKRRADLEECIRARIGMINVESETELMHLEDIGKHFQVKIPAAIRINTRHRPREAREFMAGGPSQFGMDEEDVVQKLRKFEHRYIQYEGIHTFVASQVLDFSSLVRHFERVAKISREIANALDFDLRFINFGGGFGVPYSPNETHLNLNSLGEQVNSRLAYIFPDTNNRPRFYIELGRYLVAECGIFLTEILDVKRSRGHDFVITDSGINGLSRPAMPWAQQHSCSLISKVGATPTGTYDLVGPTCMPSDILCENIALADPKPGDVIAIHNAGAYGWTMSMLFWSSHPTPAEVLFHDGEFSVIRRRLTDTELFADASLEESRLG